MDTKVITETKFSNLKLFKKGKVRDIYDLGNSFLMISTDRLSAFDVIMQQGIPLKGKILTQISEFWFDYFKYDIENHVISTDIDQFPEETKQYRDDLIDRTMLVKKAKMIPLECIVRGYLSGSGWKDYQSTGEIGGIKLPQSLVESDKLPEPIFTPSTKAEIGDHDETISHQKAIDLVGEDTFNFLKEKTLEIYSKAADFAKGKGIIIADTKMEFGIVDGKIILIDELLTPDSSRFWPADKYEKGRAQDSFDKQYVRDYLLSINFNKKPPAPILPDEVIQNTSKKYLEALVKLTGKSI
ncbi:phosphoribosylaminoimidazole-succinocarboxamide synthase [bacterium BMS3Abin04]|nr:phosphoribosylaminoimidazole-succinocarboxamide synthase [bacterium BMS3Abin04]